MQASVPIKGPDSSLLPASTSVVAPSDISMTRIFFGYNKCRYGVHLPAFYASTDPVCDQKIGDVKRAAPVPSPATAAPLSPQPPPPPPPQAYFSDGTPPAVETPLVASHILNTLEPRAHFASDRNVACHSRRPAMIPERAVDVAPIRKSRALHNLVRERCLRFGQVHVVRPGRKSIENSASSSFLSSPSQFVHETPSHPHPTTRRPLAQPTTQRLRFQPKSTLFAPTVNLPIVVRGLANWSAQKSLQRQQHIMRDQRTTPHKQTENMRRVPQSFCSSTPRRWTTAIVPVQTRNVAPRIAGNSTSRSTRRSQPHTSTHPDTMKRARTRPSRSRAREIVEHKRGPSLRETVHTRVGHRKQSFRETRAQHALTFAPSASVSISNSLESRSPCRKVVESSDRKVKTHTKRPGREAAVTRSSSPSPSINDASVSLADSFDPTQTGAGTNDDGNAAGSNSNGGAELSTRGRTPSPSPSHSRPSSRSASASPSCSPSRSLAIATTTNAATGADERDDSTQSAHTDQSESIKSRDENSRASGTGSDSPSITASTKRTVRDDNQDTDEQDDEEEDDDEDGKEIHPSFQKIL